MEEVEQANITPFDVSSSQVLDENCSNQGNASEGRLLQHNYYNIAFLTLKTRITHYYVLENNYLISVNKCFTK